MGVILIYLFIIGMFLGSFYNVVAIRLCKNESIVFPGSHCVNCNHKLSWYELIPVFSYLFLRGKCKECKQHISIQYPLIEFCTGLLFALSFYLYGFSFDTLISIILCSIVIITYITDSRYMIILDEVIIVGSIFLGIVYFISGGIMNLLSHLVGGIIIFLIMLIIKLLGDKAFKQESLGWGDVKLSFVAGLALSPISFTAIRISPILLGLAYIVIASFLAFPYALYASIKNKEAIVPFGPFLASSLLIVFWNVSLMNMLINTLFFR